MAAQSATLAAADREQVRQNVRLCSTVPHFGGKRWWMICPYRGIRVAKLYLPPGGDRFASRKAWQLDYQSQRDAPRDKPFERLFRLQKKLGCKQGWEAGLYRPKGMRNRTFERHLERYWELDAECAVEMMAMLGRLRRSLKVVKACPHTKSGLAANDPGADVSLLSLPC